MISPPFFVFSYLCFRDFYGADGESEFENDIDDTNSIEESNTQQRRTEQTPNPLEFINAVIPEIRPDRDEIEDLVFHENFDNTTTVERERYQHDQQQRQSDQQEQRQDDQQKHPSPLSSPHTTPLPNPHENVVFNSTAKSSYLLSSSLSILTQIEATAPGRGPFDRKGFFFSFCSYFYYHFYFFKKGGECMKCIFFLKQYFIYIGLCMVEVIPEMNAIIVGSQNGGIALMRLFRHKEKLWMVNISINFHFISFFLFKLYILLYIDIDSG